MLIKPVTPAILVLLVFSLLGCGDADNETSTRYNFQDQNLQGTVNSKAFNFGDGSAEDDGDELDMEMYDDGESFNDICDFSISNAEGIYIFLSLPKTVGIYRLNFDFDDLEGNYIATVFDATANVNLFATDGAVEILSISNSEVKGRMDASFNDGNNVNGNFTLTICP